MTIKGKIIFASILVFGATLAVFAVLVYESSKKAELAKLDARIESHCDKIETELEEQLSEGQFPNLADFHEIRTEGLPSVLVQIRDSSGNVIVADSAFGKLTENRWQPRFLRDTVTANVRGQHLSYRCHWLPIEFDDRTRMVLEVAAPLNEVHENLEHLRALFLITIPGALFLAALAAYLITRAAFRPLTVMAKAAQSISASNLDQRLEVPATKDEVRSLAETLNHMIARIEAAFRSQRQFVADASHEIRTPLTIINSELEYAQKTTEEPVVRESIAVSLAEIDRLSRMVEGLLLLTRLDSTQASIRPQVFRLDELTVETVQLMRRLAESRKVVLDLYVQEALEVKADPDMVKRALLNVLENAVKYSPAETTISIALRTDKDRPDITKVEITDRGPGIPESDQPHLFKRFFRSPDARSSTSGSGLGLAIASKLLELNAGKIRLRSVVGEGTSVTIELARFRAD